jgi:hypothetical protein
MTRPWQHIGTLLAVVVFVVRPSHGLVASPAMKIFKKRHSKLEKI